MTKLANTATARWYLCECERQSCREEFYMKVREYENAHLGNGKLVVPSHKPRGAKVLSRWDGAVMIQKEKKANGNR